MKLTFKKIRTVLICLFAILDLIIFFVWQNNDVVTTYIDYTHSKIPKSFEGYKIVQISDLHNKEFSNKQHYLLNKIQKTQPDMIVITGDLIDKRHTDLEIAMEFINGAVKIAPVYYVSGNHESWTGMYTQLTTHLTAVGVTVLDDKSTSIEVNGSFIDLIGVADPSFAKSDNLEYNSKQLLNQKLKILTKDKSETFKILLSHRPELFDVYKDNKINLAFCGHAHGGQIRLPFIGGIVAPNQGFFPKYTSGTYSEQDTTMVVSRGLGNSLFPFRVFNRPEIVVVTLQAK
jgi:predicted MPP superfamily phosphohydrolase